MTQRDEQVGGPGPCARRPHCPGCDWLERPYPEQLAGKTAIVRQALGRYPALAGKSVAECLGTEQRQRYRPRVKWVVQGARIGLYGPAHTVIDTAGCPAVPAGLEQLSAALRRRPAEHGQARLGALDLRQNARGEALAVLVFEAPTRDEAERAARQLADWLQAQQLPDLVGVAWSWRRPGAATVLGDTPVTLWGKSALVDRIGRVATEFPPGSFSQAHAGQTERLHELLRAWLGQERPAQLVDLFAGTGGLGLALADLADETLLVEPFRPAAAAARRSAAWLDLPATVLTTTAEQVLQELLAAPGLPGARPGGRGVVVDPPRRGLSWAALTALARLRPERLAYVSCAPATLARDLAWLAAAGLSCRSLQPLDLMPGTSQVETLALLVPDRPWRPPILAAGPGWELVDRPPRLLPPTPGALLPAPLSGLTLEWTTGTGALAEAARPAPALTWTALVRGEAPADTIIARPLPDGAGGRRRASTRLRRLALTGNHSLVELELTEGDLGTLRRHLALIGHPLLGDARWGDERANHHLAARHGLIRPFLHATALVLEDGRRFTTALAPDLQAVLDSLAGAEGTEADGGAQQDGEQE